MPVTSKNFKVAIREQYCKGCGLCIRFCPQNVLTMSEAINSQGYTFAVPKLQEKCTGCLNCVQVCPDMAIEVYRDDK